MVATPNAPQLSQMRLLGCSCRHLFLKLDQVTMAVDRYCRFIRQTKLHLTHSLVDVAQLHS